MTKDLLTEAYFKFSACLWNTTLRFPGANVHSRENYILQTDYWTEGFITQTLGDEFRSFKKLPAGKVRRSNKKNNIQV